VKRTRKARACARGGGLFSFRGSLNATGRLAGSQLVSIVGTESLVAAFRLITLFYGTLALW